MKKKRSKLKENYDLQVSWKSGLFQHPRHFHVLEEINNFDNSPDFVARKLDREKPKTVAHYFDEVKAKQLEAQGLVFEIKELEKIKIISLNNDRDETIKTLILKLNKGSKWIISLHGWGENMYSALHQAYLLSQLGFNILTFDFRGHGQSYGTQTDFGFRSHQDLARVVNYLKMYHQMNHYGLIGVSFGASTALRYIQKHGYQDPHLKFVITDSAFANLDQALSSYAQQRFATPWWKISKAVRQKFIDLFGYEPQQYDLTHTRDMKHIAKIPILFIHGQKDSYVKPKHAKTLYAKKIVFEMPRHSQLLLVPKVNHKEALHKANKTYTQGIMSFLKNINETS